MGEPYEAPALLVDRAVDAADGDDDWLLVALAVDAADDGDWLLDVFTSAGPTAARWRCAAG